MAEYKPLQKGGLVEDLGTLFLGGSRPKLFGIIPLPTREESIKAVAIAGTAIMSALTIHQAVKTAVPHYVQKWVDRHPHPIDELLEEVGI